MQSTPARSDTPDLQHSATDCDIAIVESFFEAMVANDVERALALLADDVVYQNVPFPADHGKAAVRRTFKAFGLVVTNFEVHMRKIAARNGVVLTERVDVLHGPLLYLDLFVFGTFEIRNGQIAVWRDYFNLASAMAKLLVSPIRWLLHAKTTEARMMRQ
jgi:limonene-1,2-epoxide hydrolase